MPAPQILGVLDVLRRGRDRILRGWTQHAPARNATGISCGANEPAAVAWCATGAAAYSDERRADWRTDPCYAVSRKALEELRRSLAELTPHEDYGGHLGPWNDMRERTQADVARLYDHTIARLEREPCPLIAT